MGREVRKVPANWEHPKDRGHYVPMHDEDYETKLAEWLDWKSKWDSGLRPDYDFKVGEYVWKPLAEWDGSGEFVDEFGEAPQSKYYRPKWTDEERTHFQIYETVSEGTPLSPPMPDLESLARWCADNKVDSGGCTATYEQWLAMCKAGSCPSMLMVGGRILSGVQACADL